DADFLTVTPFLGSESLHPFYEACIQHNKGIFVLVKTSNLGSGEIQNVITASGLTVSESIAKCVSAQAERSVGKYGYSPIGAVVGATYPKEAEVLRKMMPKSYFLVPGYGAQGGGANDVWPCFNPDGLGAVVNSSRGILYTHMSDEERRKCTREEYLQKVRSATLDMKANIYEVLKKEYPNMIY
ncbi:MAG: orotidine-5'-phosphate decarboxylase, partial [Clostridia bacterium]|nr:orotidine-5'-phosphate decarboxylase [Clostridia bacterium]